MSENGKTLTYTVEVNAPASQVYRVVSTAQGMQEWFGDTVEADSREGGRMYAWWNEGYYTSGTFKHLEENHKVAYSWQGPGEVETRVRVLIEEHGDGSKVTYFHDFVAEGAEQGLNDNWPYMLENLKSVLETGVDKRLFDRPMLGFYVGGLADENLKNRLGLPVDYGIHIAGLLEGMGAEKSGLKIDDVISVIEGKEIRQFQDIGEAIRGKKGGEVITTVVYRGSKKIEMEVELSKRPVPEFPPEPEALADLGLAIYKDVLGTLKKTMADVTDEEASYNPSEGEWNAKQTLAHLLVAERWNHNALSLHPDGAKPPAYPGSSRLVDAIAATYAVNALLKELKHSMKLTLNLWKTLPEAYAANKGSYFLLTQNFEQGIRSHFDQHTAQIKAALEAARQQTAETVAA